jgi:CheY-like chemotaxis protein
MAKLLWFDNDLDYLEPYVRELREAGHEVKTVGTLAEADEELSGRVFDLLILDVMIPTRTAAEELLYPPAETERGNATGLVYFNRWRDRLKAAGTKVLVLTVRLDSRILAAFNKSGIPKSAVARKLDLRTVDDFTGRVGQILKSAPQF